MMRFVLALCGFAGLLVIVAGLSGRDGVEILRAIAAGVGLLVFSVAMGLADLIHLIYQVRDGAWQTAELTRQVREAVRRARPAGYEEDPI
jgi:hypothetical protein